jgi:hypothetical protein
MSKTIRESLPGYEAHRFPTKPVGPPIRVAVKRLVAIQYLLFLEIDGSKPLKQGDEKHHSIRCLNVVRLTSR